ncbi:hypothetical protein CROQUDRAFT_672522 [Cronartium quercuum f. sp. fusiforme G11]|uniref:Uncharacterized protein n=1 Tax=Cronartium quercuum f. sp. fusiforme G11 TaxID=708437 RepID=A0A9P6NID0_9BASI|nr:hypothetical protein CROQUDRAFT_672522 [Cronartium quercuum f. sp. fusiforme G11]
MTSSLNSTRPNHQRLHSNPTSGSTPNSVTSSNSPTNRHHRPIHYQHSHSLPYLQSNPVYNHSEPVLSNHSNSPQSGPLSIEKKGKQKKGAINQLIIDAVRNVGLSPPPPLTQTRSNPIPTCSSSLNTSKTSTPILESTSIRPSLNVIQSNQSSNVGSTSQPVVQTSRSRNVVTTPSTYSRSPLPFVQSPSLSNRSIDFNQNSVSSVSSSARQKALASSHVTQVTPTTSINQITPSTSITQTTSTPSTTHNAPISQNDESSNCNTINNLNQNRIRSITENEIDYNEIYEDITNPPPNFSTPSFPPPNGIKSAIEPSDLSFGFQGRPNSPTPNYFQVIKEWDLTLELDERIKNWNLIRIYQDQIHDENFNNHDSNDDNNLANNNGHHTNSLNNNSGNNNNNISLIDNNTNNYSVTDPDPDHDSDHDQTIWVPIRLVLVPSPPVSPVVESQMIESDSTMKESDTRIREPNNRILETDDSIVEPVNQISENDHRIPEPGTSRSNRRPLPTPPSIPPPPPRPQPVFSPKRPLPPPPPPPPSRPISLINSSLKSVPTINRTPLGSAPKPPLIPAKPRSMSRSSVLISSTPLPASQSEINTMLRRGSSIRRRPPPLPPSLNLQHNVNHLHDLNENHIDNNLIKEERAFNRRSLPIGTEDLEIRNENMRSSNALVAETVLEEEEEEESNRANRRVSEGQEDDNTRVTHDFTELDLLILKLERGEATYEEIILISELMGSKKDQDEGLSDINLIKSLIKFNKVELIYRRISEEGKIKTKLRVGKDGVRCNKCMICLYQFKVSEDVGVLVCDHV